MLIKYFKVNKILVEQNLSLVIAFAKLIFLRRIGPDYKSMNIMDVIEEGNIGLKKAVDKYDPSLGNEFSTYAMYWVRQAIKRSIANKASIIRRPVYSNKVLREAEQTNSDYYNKHNKNLSNETLAKKLKIKAETLVAILRSNEEVASLDEPIHDDDSNKTPLINTIRDKKDIMDIIINDDNINDIKKLFEIANTPSKHKLILILMCGMDLKTYMSIDEFIYSLNDRYSKEEIGQLYSILSRNVSELSLENIGKIFKVSRSNIENTKTRALKKLNKAYYIYEEQGAQITSNDSDARTLSYYSNLGNKERLNNNDIQVLIAEARKILDILNENNIRKSEVKKSVLVNGYEKEFEFSTHDIGMIINYLETEHKNKKLENKLKYYYEYAKIVEKLILSFTYLKVDIIRKVIVKRSLYDFEKKDMYDIMIKIDRQLRLTIDKFMKTDEIDIEGYIKPYITKTFKDQLVNKRKVKKL